MKMIGFLRPGDVYHHTAGPDQDRNGDAIMATGTNGTILLAVKTCQQCGSLALRTPYKRFCSTGCANRSRADHSEATLMRRFWEKVDKAPGHGPQGDCWVWTARKDGRGYGEIKVAGIYRKAHRLSLFGMADLQNPKFACHRCDNPLCVRRSHLFPGTAQENIQDMIDKGRKYRVHH